MDRMFVKRTAAQFKPDGFKGDDEIVVKASGIPGDYHLRMQMLPIKKDLLAKADPKSLKLSVPKLVTVQKGEIVELPGPHEITLLCNLDLAFAATDTGKVVGSLKEVLGRHKKCDVIVRVPFEVVAKLTGKKKKTVEDKQNLFFYVESTKEWMSLEALAQKTGDIATVRGSKAYKRKGAFQFRVLDWPSEDRMISACC